MKKEHPHAQVLRWIADGETVQFKLEVGDTWYELEDIDQYGSERLIGGISRCTFRIKPKTITVGDREIEAPVKSGPGHFITDTGHELSWFDDERDRSSYTGMQKRGRVFASIEAARAAQEAITALLTREPS